MDNLDEKLRVTSETTKDEVIKYAVSLWDKYEPKDLTKEEVIKYAGDTWEHSKSVHYYLDKLGISIKKFKKQYEIETPHDLAGEGNKLEWEVMHGFAYTEKDTPEKKKIFKKALKRHRIQMHHKNGNNPKLPEWLKYGAVDAVCSLLEDRTYQGGVHDWEEIRKVISSSPKSKYKKHKKELISWAVDEMEQVTPLLKKWEIMIASFLQGNKKNSEEEK